MDKIADEGISSSNRCIGLLADQPDVRYSLAQRLSGASCGEPAIVGNPSQADEHDNETDDQRNSGILGPFVDVSMRRYATTTAIPWRAKIKNSGRQLLR